MSYKKFWGNNISRKELWIKFPNAAAIVKSKGYYLVLCSASEVKLWEQGKLK